MRQKLVDADARCLQVISLTHKPVLVVGTDVPILPIPAITAALAKSSRWDVLLGPSLDGGYYLIGMNKPIEALFASVHWSSSTVFSETEQICQALGLRVNRLPAALDIDDVASLNLLREELTLNRYVAIKTRKALSDIQFTGSCT